MWPWELVAVLVCHASLASPVNVTFKRCLREIKDALPCGDAPSLMGRQHTRRTNGVHKGLLYPSRTGVEIQAQGPCSQGRGSPAAFDWALPYGARGKGIGEGAKRGKLAESAENVRVSGTRTPTHHMPDPSSGVLLAQTADVNPSHSVHRALMWIFPKVRSARMWAWRQHQASVSSSSLRPPCIEYRPAAVTSHFYAANHQQDDVG